MSALNLCNCVPAWLPVQPVHERLAGASRELGRSSKA